MSASRLAIVLLAAACGRSPVLQDRPDVDDDVDHDDDDDGCDLDSHVVDCDGDGIPDRDDPFPTDPERPGRARADVVYVHDATVLSTLDLDDTVVTPVGEFRFPEGPDGRVTDIAIDRFGVLYAVASDVLHVCDPAIAHCWALAVLPTNSLAFLRQGTIEADDDTLVTLSGATWTHVRLRGPEVTLDAVGDVREPYRSSGDIATLGTGLTVFSSPTGASGGDELVWIDPNDITATGSLVQVPDSTGVWGIAEARGRLWMFDQLGTIWTMDPLSNTVQWIGYDDAGFWGAAAHPDLR